MGPAGEAVADAVAKSFREEFGRTVAVLARALGEVDRAEEAVQDAYAVALRRWPRDGVPDRPAAWILTTAKHRAIDRLRRERVLREKQAELVREAERVVGEVPEEAEAIPDERLELIFACCHPALARDAHVPLTLRLVGGLTVAEIARALLLSEPTVYQRVTRAKRKLRATNIPLAVPDERALQQRLGGVLAVLYLIFNEGHTATEGPSLARDDLALEAIRLARVVAGLLPDEGEAVGLLALLLLTHARRPARVDAEGHLVILTHQDRTRWDQALIAEGLPLVERALRARRPPGSYALQAAIAALHARAPLAELTDWAQIAALYGALARVAPSPVVELNRAVAVGMAEGPAVALGLVERLEADGTLDDYHLLHATRADLLRRMGRRGEAAAAYARAAELTANARERAFLEARLADCAPGGW